MHIDNIIEKLRAHNGPPVQAIYVSHNTYLDILDETQEGRFDYNSPTIQALSQIMLIVDIEVEDGDYVLQTW